MRKQTLLFGTVLALAVGAFGSYAVTTQLPTPTAQEQAASPLDQLRVHLVGVHVIKDAPDRQYVAHHYCQELGPDLIQRAVFDSGGPGARLIDVEYVVSDDAWRRYLNATE